MLIADVLNVVSKCCESQLENALDTKALYINLQQSFEIVHTRQELQLRKKQRIKKFKRSLSIIQFAKLMILGIAQFKLLSVNITTKPYSGCYI